MKEFFNKIYKYFIDKAPGELIVSLIIMLVIAIIGIILGLAIRKADPKKPTKGLANIAEIMVTFADDKVKGTLGTAYLPFSTYYLFLVIYIPLAFVAGLFGLASPMNYYTIPLCLALVTWLGIQISAIIFQKLDYLKSFASPLPGWIPILAPINMLSKLSPLLSLSIRLFGNALAGSILMTLVYWGTGSLSNLILSLVNLGGNFNFVGVIVAPVLHAYFDAFSAYIQMTIFTTLTLLLIATEIPAPVNVDKNKKRKNKEKTA